MAILNYFSMSPVRMAVFGFVTGALLGLAFALPSLRGPVETPVYSSLK